MLEKLVLLVEMEILGEQCDKPRNLADGVGCGFGKFFLLQPHQEHAIESGEAGLDLAHLVVAGLASKLHDVGESAVELGGIFGKFRVGEERLMELHELIEHIFVDLEMSLLGDKCASCR